MIYVRESLSLGFIPMFVKKRLAGCAERALLEHMTYAVSQVRQPASEEPRYSCNCGKHRKI